MPTLPLTERLRPKHLRDLVGNPRAKSELAAWAERWSSTEPPARRAAVLSGPAGVGKTSAAIALARDLGWTLVEMNASEARNESAIERIAGRASITHTLDPRSVGTGPARALILLDEADCLTGRLDAGAAPRREPPPLREYLRGRYGTVEALNAAYGLKPSAKPAPFADWEAVPKSPGHFAWARLPAARRDIEDWRSSQRTTDLSDRGGMAAIARLVRATRQPVVLTVNDEQVLTRYSTVFRTAVERVRFYPIRDAEMRAHLDAVARSEKIRLAPGALDTIVRRAQGDLRAALNDLDAVAPLEAGPLQLSVLGFRDRGSDFAAFTEEALSASRFYRSVEVQERLDAPPDDLLPWIEENLPHFAPDPGRRAAAFDVLAVAERFLGRARRARVWSQWSYASELLSGGVGLALRDRPAGRSAGAAFPRFLGEMGRSRSLRAVRDGILARVGERLHLSQAKSRELALPFLENLFRPVTGRRGAGAVREGARRVAQELALTPEEVAFLMDAPPDSAEVRRILEAPEPEPDTREPASEPERERPGPPGRRQRSLADFGG